MSTPVTTYTTSAAEMLISPDVASRISELGDEIGRLQGMQEDLAQLAGVGGPEAVTWSQVFNGYAAVLVGAFLVTLAVTPLMRRMAVSHGIVDRPNDPRKIHKMPIAYLGGAAVFLGVMAGIVVSYLGVRFPDIVRFHDAAYSTETGQPGLVPPWIVLGITVIMLIGLIDDVVGISPRVKVGGQLFAAAALAYGQIGTNVAAGLLTPTLGTLLNNPDLTYTVVLPDALSFLASEVTIDIVYWTGTAVIAVFVLGGCNASNLVDGLDGLCSGVTGIAMIGLLAVAIMMIADPSAAGPLDSARLVLCMAVLGACLGFLPHNFNPATIFLGDCGSLMLGFLSVVVILTLGDTGRTDLVVAGLFIYAVPIIDTALAIIRRKLAKRRMSDPDSDHLHHMLKRALGVKGAALTLYLIAGGFAVLGVSMAATNARIIYTVAILMTAFIGVYAIKIARRKQIEQEMAAKEADRAAGLALVTPESGPSGGSAAGEVVEVVGSGRG